MTSPKLRRNPSITQLVREALPPPRQEFTSAQVIDDLWECPDLQDLPEPVLRKELQQRLIHLRTREEIQIKKRVTVPGGYFNVYVRM
tara:strand:+ start:7944 stop:8204 length:261 start_codon:yes stop_codon:yes gene_type:complete